jgi:hypothetical protein
MTGKRVFFFATEQDLQQLITAFEAKARCQYYEEGSFENDIVVSYKSLLDVPRLGTVQHGDWNHATRLLVLPKNVSLVVRPCPQRRGGMRYIIDSAENPRSFTLTLGGVFQPGVLVASGAITSATDEAALGLFGCLARLVKKQPRTGVFYLGQQASGYFEQGWRLITNAQSPPEYDLAKE